MQDGKYVVGMVSKEVHARSHIAALQRRGFVVRVLGAEHWTAPANMDIVVVRSQSCSHAASDAAFAWFRGAEGRGIVASNGLTEIVNQCSAWRDKKEGKDNPLPAATEDTDKSKSVLDADSILIDSLMKQILNTAGFFTVQMVGTDPEFTGFIATHLGDDSSAAISSSIEQLRDYSMRQLRARHAKLAERLLVGSPYAVAPWDAPAHQQIIFSDVDYLSEYWQEPEHRRALLEFCGLRTTTIEKEVEPVRIQTLTPPSSTDHAAATAAGLPNGLIATALDTKAPSVQAPVPLPTAPVVVAAPPPAQVEDPLVRFKAKLRELVPLMHAAGISELHVADGDVSLVRTVVNKGLVTAEG